MKKLFYLFVLLNSLAYCQITIQINNLPISTPLNSTIYIAGTMNNWSPNDLNYIMQPINNYWQISIPEGIGSLEFKFTRGSWSSVEGNSLGTYLPNRTVTFTGVPQVINLNILSWEDISGSSNQSTAASNVQILNSQFFMPQLDRYRRIWLYLPPDYNTTTKHYPVLYMQDGQNLFDNATSYAGEWQVDETLNSLFNQGDYGAIVVGIDNGGSERINEYSPWINSQYGGGQGSNYMNFIATTLKPFIDSNFRTRPEPKMNALIGSSMGALISTYGACEFPSSFQKVGSFSAAYWFALGELNSYIASNQNLFDTHRAYFVAGQNEYTTIVGDISGVVTNLQSKGLLSTNTLTKFDSYGTHSESYWRGEFAAAYLWLFQNENLEIETNFKSNAKIYQTNSGKIILEGFDECVQFELYNLLGQKAGQFKWKNGENYLDNSLTKGIYFLKYENNPSKFVKIFKN